MNGGTLMRDTMIPLSEPTARPTTMATRTVIQTWPGLAFAVAAPAMADTAITLPTDRSMPPVRTTSVCPSAISANGAAATRMVSRLSTVPNRALR